MTKRAFGKFKRRAQDAYDTPPKAVLPLLPHIPAKFSYWEPCAGSGAIINALSEQAPDKEPFCAMASDIVPRGYDIRTMDALTIPRNTVRHEWKCDLIITNPPWTRDILHPLIDHLSGIRPTWLLFYADWMHTRQALPYLAKCAKIVSVGRVSWMGNGVSGFDNCAWYNFDVEHDGPTEFHGWGA